ncbi:uncharacterized protein [Nicotiana sylvestris]|uniref:uncharacterized protein n=1 Tax=Nicotiana sylvestris TaxID=4096 RepID=UPI00388CA786
MNKGKMEDLNIRKENTAKRVEATDGHGIQVPNENVSQLEQKLLKFQEELDHMLKKDAATKWTDDCHKVFNKIKEYLSTPPVLVPPEPGRPLLLYLAVLDGAFIYVLEQHDETGRKEQAIYYLICPEMPPLLDTCHHDKGTSKRAQCNKLTMTVRGMDVIGPIELDASNEHNFVLVAIDYFAKWVEATSYKAVTKKVVADFVLNCIVCRFRIPESIITDNGSNLNNNLMKAICNTFKIRHKNSIAYMPQMNGAIKAANKNIKKILRKMIEKHKQWHEKLSFALMGIAKSLNILYAHGTNIRNMTLRTIAVANICYQHTPVMSCKPASNGYPNMSGPAPVPSAISNLTIPVNRPLTPTLDVVSVLEITSSVYSADGS